MSHVVVVEKNKDGKIELTKDELQKMLDDAYSKGFSDGKATRWGWDTITYPSCPIWYTETTATDTVETDKITLNAKDVSET